MPKKKLIKSTLIIIALSLICMYIYDNYKVEVTTSFIIKEKESCKDNLKKYIKIGKNTFYLYCLEDVVVDYTDRTLELNKALEAKQMDVDTIKELSEKKYSLNNEKINFYQNKNISMLECIHNDGNTYIIGKNFEYTEGMCNSKPYLSKYEKDYYILDISPSKTENFMYVTLRDLETEKVDTITMDNTYELKEDCVYTFTFGKYNNKIITDIKNEFSENVLLDITFKQSEQELLEETVIIN